VITNINGFKEELPCQDTSNKDFTWQDIFNSQREAITNIDGFKEDLPCQDIPNKDFTCKISSTPNVK